MSEDTVPRSFKPHLTTKHEGCWKIMWHRKSDYFIWSTPKDFADACRYLKLCDIAVEEQKRWEEDRAHHPYPDPSWPQPVPMDMKDS